MKQSGSIGHRRTLNGKQVIYPYGIGCIDHPDCFTCPKPDCNWDKTSDYRKRKKANA